MRDGGAERAIAARLLGVGVDPVVVARERCELVDHLLRHFHLVGPAGELLADQRLHRLQVFAADLALGRFDHRRSRRGFSDRLTADHTRMGGLERGVAQQRDFAGAVIEHRAQALADFDVGGVHAHQRGVQVRPFVKFDHGQQLGHFVGELGQRGHARDGEAVELACARDGAPGQLARAAGWAVGAREEQPVAVLALLDAHFVRLQAVPERLADLGGVG